MAEQAYKILSDQGWYIAKEGYDLLSESVAKSDIKTITQLLLDTDIKDYGKPTLTTALNSSDISQVVLQIQKVKNISAPKSNQDSQAAPRMLKLIVTDGHTHCQAVEIGDLPFLNHNKTPPGSKLLIKKAVFNSGYIFLEENSCIFLGGKVPSLYEKWEINRTVSKHNRAACDGEGPPPWVSFGHRIQSSLNNQPFKSLDNKQKIKESSEFDVQRQDAIAEASTGAVKKVFGGGVRQIQGASQIRERKQQGYKERGNERKVKKELQKEEKLQKPPEKVSLFDFLENKLPTNDELPVNNVVKKPIENTELKTNNTRNTFNYDKPKFNQPRNTYPTNPTNNWHQQNNYNNWHPQNNYNNFQQEYNPNYNYYQQNKRNQYTYNNPQASNYNSPRNTQYKPNHVQYPTNRVDDRNVTSLSDNFQQMNVNDSYAAKKTNHHEKVQNLTTNKSTNEKGADRNINVNSEFASRSFRMHLNIKSDSPRRPNSEAIPTQMKETRKVETQESDRQDTNTQASAPNTPINWKVGDQCMAKYWEDNKFYRATVTAFTNRTCVVQFNDYGNFEEILHGDCLPLENEQQGFNKRQPSNTMEFRRGGNRPYNNRNFAKPK